MLRRLEILLGACFYYSGLVKLARFWTQRSGQKLVILCHHRASGKLLRGQLLYLKRHYRLMHLEAALEELYAPSKDQKPRRDSRTLLAIAFDDGYQDNYTQAFALARELQIPITIFLVPPYIESGRPFSWLAGEDGHLVPYAQVKAATIEGQTYPLNTVAEQKKLAQIIDDRIRYPKSIASRESYLKTVREALGVPASTTEGEKKNLSVTWSEVAEMAASEWVSFGAHTMNHPILTCLTDPLEVEYEISESRVVLEQKLGHPVRTFAYPYGEYGDRELRAARAAGYTWAVTTIEGFNSAQTDPHQLYRLVVGEHQHWLILAVKVSGVWEFFLRPCRAAVQFIGKIFGHKPEATRSL